MLTCKSSVKIKGNSMSKFLVTILAVVLASCQPKSPIDGNSGHNALFSFLSNNPACTAEGSLVTMGLDKNDNGVLDVNEVQYSMDVCNGIKGDIGDRKSTRLNSSHA